MKEKIIQRKYKKDYNGLLVIAFFIFLVLLVQNKAIECQSNEECVIGVHNMNTINIIWYLFIIVLIAGYFIVRTDPKNYVEVEIEGNVIEKKINIGGRKK